MSFSSKTALPVEIKDLKTNTVKIFNSNVKAAKYLNVSEFVVIKIVKNFIKGILKY